jgi:hypothetical protein
MRRFAQLTTVEAALAWFDSALPAYGSLDVEDEPLIRASGPV